MWQEGANGIPTRRVNPLLGLSVRPGDSMGEGGIGRGRCWKCVEAFSHKKSAQDECDTDKGTAGHPSGQRLCSEQDTGRAEKPDTDPNRHEIRKPRRVSHLERESHSHRTREQCKQGISHVMRLWRDPGEGKHQPQHKGDAVHNGHPIHNRSPRNTGIPVAHMAQGMSITEN